MVKQSRRKEVNGSKGLETNSPGLARWGERDGAGGPASSLSDCNRDGVRGTAGGPGSSISDCYRIGSWNVRGLNSPGKLENVLLEMNRLDLDVLGVSETFWDGVGEFDTEIPVCEDRFRVIFSGGSKKRRGVAIVVRNNAATALESYESHCERIMIARLKAKPVNILLVQVYAPCEDCKEEDRMQFYMELDQVIRESKKGRECVIVMGDFNGKVGLGKEEDTVGPFGLGLRNENGQSVVDFCRTHELFATNTWFQQKRHSTALLDLPE